MLSLWSTFLMRRPLFIIKMHPCTLAYTGVSCIHGRLLPCWHNLISLTCTYQPFTAQVEIVTLWHNWAYLFYSGVCGNRLPKHVCPRSTYSHSSNSSLAWLGASVYMPLTCLLLLLHVACWLYCVRWFWVKNKIILTLNKWEVIIIIIYICSVQWCKLCQCLKWTDNFYPGAITEPVHQLKRNK